MCGILGVRRSFLDDPASFRAAVDAMAWRGPDGPEQITAGDWHLAVARLIITDPENGQPLWSTDRRRVIAFNGAVTSAVAERAASVPATGNDAELPLLRLALYGPSGLLETSGHYALAILEPETDRLWFARDPHGEKPLYIVRRGGEVVAFASTVQSLRRLGLAIELGPAERARFLRFGFGLGPTITDPNLTLESDLRGAILHDGAAVPQIWSHVLPGHRSGTGYGNLKDRLVRAASRCATTEVPAALALSGGVDSSCLAAALRIGGHRIPAYQFRARNEPDHERARARRVADHLDVELRLVDAGAEILREVPRLTRQVGLPLGDPSVLAVHALARAARADGVRVMLSGEGADELFLGYRRHRAARLLPRRAVPLLPPVGPGLSMSTGARLWRAAAAREPYDTLLEVAPPGFRRAVFAADTANGELPETPDAPSTLHRARHVDRAYYLRHDLLPKLDTALMAAGVEGRCPFLDPDVVASEEATNKDPRAILGKRHLRAAFRDDLPAGVLDRRKLGFAVPLDRWLREDPFLPDLLRDHRTVNRPHLRARGLAAMLDRHLSGRSDLGHPLFLVAAYECHLRNVEETAA